jgi:hypothetical protein
MTVSTHSSGYLHVSAESFNSEKCTQDSVGTTQNHSIEEDDLSLLALTCNKRVTRRLSESHSRHLRHNRKIPGAMLVTGSRSDHIVPKRKQYAKRIGTLDPR